MGGASIGKTIIIKYTGKKVIAVVNEVPSTCDKSNHIIVLLDGLDYEVSISRDDCKKGVYKVGQKVTLLKNEKYKELLWPESQPELMPLLIIAAFILAYISMKGRFKIKRHCVFFYKRQSKASISIAYVSMKIS